MLIWDSNFKNKFEIFQNFFWETKGTIFRGVDYTKREKNKLKMSFELGNCIGKIDEIHGKVWDFKRKKQSINSNSKTKFIFGSIIRFFLKIDLGYSSILFFLFYL